MNTCQIPGEAKFVIYLYSRTKSTMQKTLLTQNDKPHPNKVPMTREDIRKSEA